MPRVVFTWELGGGMGHLASVRTLAYELKTRGCDVAAIVKDPDAAGRLLPGVPLYQAPVKLFTRPPRFEQAATFSHVLHNTAFDDVAACTARTRVWRTLFEQLRPGRSSSCEPQPDRPACLTRREEPRRPIGELVLLSAAGVAVFATCGVGMLL